MTGDHHLGHVVDGCECKCGDVALCLACGATLSPARPRDTDTCGPSCYQAMIGKLSPALPGTPKPQLVTQAGFFGDKPTYMTEGELNGHREGQGRLI